MIVWYPYLTHYDNICDCLFPLHFYLWDWETKLFPNARYVSYAYNFLLTYYDNTLAFLNPAQQALLESPTFSVGCAEALSPYPVSNVDGNTVP